MRSRAESRPFAEWLLRSALLVTLVVALWRSLARADVSPVTVATRASALAIGALVSNPALSAIDLTSDALLTRGERDALVALRRAGVTVRWTGAPPALVVDARRVREPDGRVRVLVTGGGTTPVAIVDSAGLLDSVRAGAGATVEAASVVGAVRAQQGLFRASTAVPDAGVPRAVLILGRADWDTRFAMQALSEAGWVVRARIPTAPGVTVRDDGLLPLDTARYDVVVALDTSAADLAPAIARFVAQGGGLVAGSTALEVAQLRALAPARAGDRRAGRILLAEDSVTPSDLPVRALSLARSDAIPLERAPAGITLAARRAGMGRVVAIGYDESWRWRMLGGLSGMAAHRQWWSRAVGSVAPERAAAVHLTGDAAPLASLVSALGPASAPVASANQSSRDPLPFMLLIIAAASLLAETASRRFRGER